MNHKHILFLSLFALLAAIINVVSENGFDLDYAYLTGSVLFVIPTTWFMLHRRDLFLMMLICGLVAIPFGIFTEYFFYTRDWWRPLTITGTRIGIEDVIYSFFHGALLSTTGLVLLDKKITLENVSYKKISIKLLTLSVIVGILGYLGIVILNIPSFILATIIFLMVGLYFILIQPKLIKVGIAGMLGTLGWCIPIFWITNGFFPNWIQTFWTNKTDSILILQIPLPDLCWYSSVGFVSAILPESLMKNK